MPSRRRLVRLGARPRRRPLRLETLEARRLLANVPAGFTETQIVGGLTSPTTLRAAPDGRVFVGFQTGEIRVVEHDALLGTPFASLAADGAGERGLQGLAFDPHFASNGYLYVYYTAASPQSHNRVSRLQADPTAPNRMLAGSETVLLELPALASLPDNPNPIWHMGGALHVAADGTLRVQTGDHVNPSLVQNLNSPLGKVLRLNLDGSVPTDNPYYSAADGLSARDYVWSLGLRNPYSGDIDPLTGRHFIGDVGLGSWEEINDATAPARNFGWPATEGDFDPAAFPNFARPVYAYGHDEDCAITGGAFYRPATAQFPSAYEGVYFFSEFCAGEIQYVDPGNLAAGAQPFLSGAAYPLHITVAADGSLYYLARGAGAGGDPGLGTGQLRKVLHAANAAPSIADPPDDLLVSAGYSATFSAAVNGTAPLALQWQRRSAGGGAFVDVPGATAASYVLANAALADDGAQFRLRATNGFGAVDSPAATLRVTTNRPPTATISSPSAALRYSAGDVIQFAGGGADAEDGALPASALVWWVDFHHDSHVHPFLPATSGVAGGEFTVPVVSETDPDVFFRLHLRATDSVGLSTETTADILPRKANLTLAANVPGLLVELDGQARATPLTVEGVANVRRLLGAAEVQSLGGQSYRFVSWSDGGARAHAIGFPAADTTLVAQYEPVALTYLSDLPFAQTPTNGWGPVERDQSNGGTAPGDGRPLTLNGTTFTRGLGVHAGSDVRFNIGGAYERFFATVGVDDEVAAGSVAFQVYGDGALLFDSGLLGAASAEQALDIDVRGVQQLRLVVTDGGDGVHSDHADWADAKLLGGSRFQATYLSDLPFAQTPTNGWGPVERDLSNGETAPGDGRPLALNGATFAKGLGVHAGSDVRFNLAGGFDKFQAIVGIDDEVSAGSVVFQVYGDGALLFDSGLRGPASPALPVDVNVQGVQQLRLVVTNGGDNIHSDHADWADAKLLTAPVYESTYVSDLAFAQTPTNGWGPVERDRSNGETAPGDGRPLTLNGATFAKGLGVHAGSDVRFNIGGAYERFQARVGLDDEVSAGSVVFQVYGDGALLFDSGLLGPSSPALPIDVNVQGVQQLRLVVTSGGDNIDSDHADWADAKLLRIAPTNQPTYAATYVSDLPFALPPTNGWGPVERDRSNGETPAGDGRPLTLNGATFAKGLGVHAASDVRFNLGGTYDRFQAKVGLDDEVSAGSVVFQVYGDAVLLFDSGLLGPKSPALPVDVNVQGVQQLRLVVTDGGDNIDSDHADWADAKLLRLVAAPAALSVVENAADSSTEEEAPAAPQALADRYVLGAARSALATTSVLANDVAAAGATLSALLTTEPARGDVELLPDGTFSYTPGGNFHGYDTFKYRVSDAYSTGNEVTVEIFSHTGALVAKAYQTVLGRAFDLAGLEYWVQRIDAPGGSLSDFAVGVFESRERLEPIIKNWYRQYLGRAQDPQQSEIDYYYARWRNEGGPQNMLPDLFASAEFYANSGGTNRGWILELYRLIVQRTTPPTANEIAFYEGRLNDGASRQAVVRGYLFSPERLGLIVNDLYQRILGRAPTATEKQREVDALGAGKTEKDLQLQLLDSNEYRGVPSKPSTGNAVLY